MRKNSSVLVILTLLFLLAACASATVEPQAEAQLEVESTPFPTTASKPTSSPGTEVAMQAQATVAKPTETATQAATAMPTETPTTTATIVTDPPKPVPRETKSGIPEVDFVIDTVLSNDLEMRQALVRFVTIGCTTVEGLGTTPKCEDGQAEGTLVDFFPLGGPGEGHSVLASEVAGVLDFEAESLYAVYVVSEELPDFLEFPHGTYALFFTLLPSGESYNDFVILRVDDEGYIVRLDRLGGMTLDFYFEQKVADLLETPPQSVMFASEAADILVYPPEIDE